jgi:diguanylate cyclase (GGDEF)-like protein/PAS domain S-box-containing protein
VDTSSSVSEALQGRTTSPTAWRWFLALEAVFALIYFPFSVTPGQPRIFGFLPWMEWDGQVPAWALLGLSAVAAIVYGIRRNRPNAPLAWWFLAAGVLLFITGDTTYKFWHQIMGQQNIPFPSFIDAIYITMYPVLAVGLLLLARKRVPGDDQASLIDALTITLGVGLLSWIFLIGPNVRGPGTSLVRLTAAAYPLGDILLLAMLAHLWSNGGFRHVAGRLLAIGAVGTLISDSLYGLANLHASANWHDGNLIDLGWIVFYSCWGAAALHPSMRALSEPKPAVARRTSNSRLMLLAGVSLIAPVVLLVEAELGHPVDAPVIAVVAGLMFLLVLLRMGGLVRAHEQSVTREKVLRKSVAELVAAAGRDGIYAAAIAGFEALVSGHRDVIGVALSMANPGGEAVIVGRAGVVPDHESEYIRSIWTELRSGLADRTMHSCAVVTLPGAEATASTGRRLVCALAPLGKLQGVVTITSATGLPVEFTNSIEILAAQVELALDREAMTEVIHVRRSEARFQTLVQNASDVILIVRPDTTITYQTPSALKILGYAPGSLEGVSFTSLLHPDDVEQALAGYTSVAVGAGSSSVTALWRIQHFDGSWRHVEVIAMNLLSDITVEGMVLTLRDVSERVALEDELKHQAFHDALSGLANRALFRDRLEHALLRASRSGTSLAVLFIDLDDFKLVNDSLGHAAGDELLVTVGERITASLRAADTAARFGGDEFAVLLEETASPQEAFDVATRILAELGAPVMVEEHEIMPRASIGIALSPEGAEDPADLMQAADVAMYAAKAAGKGRYEEYRPELQSAILDRLDRTADLQRAMQAQEFELYYQPIISLDGHELVGHEALIRWNHPERGLLLPGDFIPLAEETGLIVVLGRWVLAEACQQARFWQLQHPDAGRMRMSVNMSARQFQHVDLVEDVSTILRDVGLDPHLLVLEITESMLIQNVGVIIERMWELKELGVAFAIDDFGTGYSSLSYLKDFPIDILKLDKSFVDEVGTSTANSALAETIVMLGKNLNLQTVAEGIEATGQLDALRALGCTFGQGFYVAKPLTSREVDSVLSRTFEGKTSGGSNGLDVGRIIEEVVG